MRQGPSGRRPRGRHHGGGNGGGGGNASPGSMNANRPRSVASLRHQTFDSNGPDVRVRGNAWQVYEKYQGLARDAMASGDRVTAENLLQHAEHYYRIIEAINEATAVEQRHRGGGAQPFGQQPDVPANYYTQDGNLAVPQGAQPSARHPEASANAPQAEVQKRTPPPSPFFTPEETEESVGNPEPLAARR